jgi:tRNA(Ile)-lysidine synthase
MTHPEDGFQDNLPSRVLQIARKNGHEHLLLRESLVVGVSGGADSLALLHILIALRGEQAINLHVAHINHGFRRSEGQEDAEFVRRTAQEWGLPFTTCSFDVPAYAKHHKLSGEDAARRVRYAFLAGVAAQVGGTVTVAHNADDQVETVLLNMLRGTGVSGLAAMDALGLVPILADEPEFAGLSNVALPTAIEVFRPLLSIWREEITRYCEAVGLHPRTDATNQDPKYRRNQIRHELLPHLEQAYSPAIKRHLFNLAEIASAEDRLVEQLADQEWGRVADVSAGTGIVQFVCGEFAQVPEALRRRIVRRAIREVAGTLEGITFEHTCKACEVLAGAQDSPSELHLPHSVVVQRRGDRALVATSKALRALNYLSQQDSLAWPVIKLDMEHTLIPGNALQLREGWVLTSEVTQVGAAAGEPGELLALFDADAIRQYEPLALRTRRPGDYIEPLGMSGRKTLQDLYVDAKIPGKLRARLPVVAPGQQTSEVLWVPGRGGRRSRHALVTANTERVLRLEFRNSESGKGDEASVGD